MELVFGARGSVGSSSRFTVHQSVARRPLRKLGAKPDCAPHPFIDSMRDENGRIQIKGFDDNVRRYPR